MAKFSDNKNNQKISMTNRLSNCLRKQLKKGGFTIERVCLYRALNTPLTDLGSAEKFWEEKLNSLSPTEGVKWICKSTDQGKLEIDNDQFQNDMVKTGHTSSNNDEKVATPAAGETGISQKLHMGYSGKSCWQVFTNKFAYCYLNDDDRIAVYDITGTVQSTVEFCRTDYTDVKDLTADDKKALKHYQVKSLRYTDVSFESDDLTTVQNILGDADKELTALSFAHLDIDIVTKIATTDVTNEDYKKLLGKNTITAFYGGDGLSEENKDIVLGIWNKVAHPESGLEGTYNALKKEKMLVQNDFT